MKTFIASSFVAGLLIHFFAAPVETYQFWCILLPVIAMYSISVVRFWTAGYRHGLKAGFERGYFSGRSFAVTYRLFNDFNTKQRTN